VKSIENPSMNIVSASDLDGSFLWHKVAGDPNSDPAVNGRVRCGGERTEPVRRLLARGACGVQMPLLAGAIEPPTCAFCRTGSPRAREQLTRAEI